MPRCGPPGPEFIARSRSTRGLLSLGCSQVFGGINTTPIVLVPGFWLGAWAWDEVAAALRAKGHEVTAMTLPGLESADADRSAITFADHVDAICEAVRAAGRPVVLAVHSGVHREHVRAVQGRRQGGQGVARRAGRAAQRYLRRPADEPLAHVVAPA